MGSVLLQSTFTSLQTAARQPRPHLIFFPRPPIPLFVVIVVVVILVVLLSLLLLLLFLSLLLFWLVRLSCLARLAIVVGLNAVLFRGSEIG